MFPEKSIEKNEILKGEVGTNRVGPLPHNGERVQPPKRHFKYKLGRWIISKKFITDSVFEKNFI
jgi:hypothetical protein